MAKKLWLQTSWSSKVAKRAYMAFNAYLQDRKDTIPAPIRNAYMFAAYYCDEVLQKGGDSKAESMLRRRLQGARTSKDKFARPTGVHYENYSWCGRALVVQHLRPLLVSDATAIGLLDDFSEGQDGAYLILQDRLGEMGINIAVELPIPVANTERLHRNPDYVVGCQNPACGQTYGWLEDEQRYHSARYAEVILEPGIAIQAWICHCGRVFAMRPIHGVEPESIMFSFDPIS